MKQKFVVSTNKSL